MEKYSIVFLLNDNNKWYDLFSHLNNVYKFPEKIDHIAVVITSNAILSCLKHSDQDALHDNMKNFQAKGVKFSICGNTIEKFQFNPDDLMPDMDIDTEGGIFKAIEYQVQGYFKFII